MRIELMTLRLQGIRSSQLSYEDTGAVFVGTCIAEQKQRVFSWEKQETFLNRFFENILIVLEKNPSPLSQINLSQQHI